MAQRKLTMQDVTFTVTVENECDSSPEDMFTCTEEVELVQERLAAGNHLAWCCIVVEAKFMGVSAKSSLGACSFEDEEEAYLETIESVKQMALDDINGEMLTALDKVEHIRNALGAT